MKFDPRAPLPQVTAGLPGIGGKIKTQIEDFEVEEIPAYPASGTGAHLFLWIEKRDMGAEFFLRQVARRLNISPADVGAAGLKDRRAITRQMISVPDTCSDHLAVLEGDGIRVLKAERHENKLRPGHLHGNRFRILIRDVAADAATQIGPLLEVIRSRGMANFYGEQRFGRDGATLQTGLELLAGNCRRRVSPFVRKLALSAVQSALFNHALAERLRDGLFRKVLEGDVMSKWPVGGMFVAREVNREQERFDAREIVHTGAIFGKKTFAAEGVAAAREEALLAEAGFDRAAFSRFGKLLQGTRRHNLVYVDDLLAVVEPEGIRISFSLPAGSYATVLIGEVTKAVFVDSDADAS
jgi:tRNA pseudouridine13 synthase